MKFVDRQKEQQRLNDDIYYEAAKLLLVPKSHLIDKP